MGLVMDVDMKGEKCELCGQTDDGSRPYKSPIMCEDCITLAAWAAWIESMVTKEGITYREFMRETEKWWTRMKGE